MKNVPSVLRDLIVESQSYFSADALPGVLALRDALSEVPPSAWRGLRPIERFFAFQAGPRLAADAGPAVIAESYCAALASLPGDWWGLPGSNETTAAGSLLSLGNSAIPCLTSMLGIADPLRFLHGEANAIAERLSLTIGDLAASFLAAILHQPFDWRAAPADRIRQRDEVEKLARRMLP